MYDRRRARKALALIPFVLATLRAHAAEDRVMYFTDPSKPGRVPITRPLIAEWGSPIDLQLEIRTHSVDDQNTFTRLVIADYRDHDPDHTGERAPNVTFEITGPRGKPVPFRVHSQGGGADLEYLDVDVGLEIGGEPERLERETARILVGSEASDRGAEEALRRLEAIRRKLAPNQPGTYRVRAVYRPRVPGKWTGELSTPAISIVIPEAK